MAFSDEISSTNNTTNDTINNNDSNCLSFPIQSDPMSPLFDMQHFEYADVIGVNLGPSLSDSLNMDDSDIVVGGTHINYPVSSLATSLSVLESSNVLSPKSASISPSSNLVTVDNYNNNNNNSTTTTTNNNNINHPLSSPSSKVATASNYNTSTTTNSTTTTINYPLSSPPMSLCVPESYIVSDATTVSPNSASISLSSNVVTVSNTSTTTNNNINPNTNNTATTTTTNNIIIKPLSENAINGDGGNGGGDGNRNGNGNGNRNGNGNGRGGQNKDKTIEMQELRNTKFRKKSGQRVVFLTKSENDNMDDGFKWRKYGQKIVKDTPYPRSYFRCTTIGCTVKKRIERHADDPSIVLTTYEGKHLHSCPVSPTSTRAVRYNNRKFKAVYEDVPAAVDGDVNGLASQCFVLPLPLPPQQQLRLQQYQTLQQKLHNYHPLQQPLQQNVPLFYEAIGGGSSSSGGGGSSSLGSQHIVPPQPQQVYQPQQQPYMQQVMDPVAFNPALPPWSTVFIESTPGTDYTMMDPPLVNAEDPCASGGAGPSTTPSGNGDHMVWETTGLLQDIVMSQLGRNP